MSLKRLRSGLAKRGTVVSLDSFTELDEVRRKKLIEVEQLKNQRNTVSKEVGRLKSQGQDAGALIQEMQQVGERIQELDQAIREHEARLEEMLLVIPNLPHESVPVGKDESENQESPQLGGTTSIRVCPAKP